MKKVTEQSNPNLSTLGGRVEYERRLKNISQQELANKLKVTRQKINYLEKGTEGRNITTEELKQIADILNVSTDYLLGRVSSKNMQDIDISMQTGLNEKSIDLLENIYSNKRSNILNSFLCGIDIEQFTKLLEQYFTIEYITEVLFNTQFNEIENNYKNNKDIIATEENIVKIKRFVEYTDKIRFNDTKGYELFAFYLKSNEKELNTISKMCIDLEDNKGKWNNKKQGKFDLKAIRILNNSFTSFKNYYLFTLVEQNLKGSIQQLGEKALKDKNIHIELKILNNE